MKWSSLKWWNSIYRETAEGIDIPEHDEYRKKVLPPREMVYRAFDLTPFNEVKCVILGQDPYHTPGMAHGLAFSVPPHVQRLPPSLQNILKEYQEDLGFPKPRCGDLSKWAKSGVLLLNTILTVEAGKPLSHRGMGWEKLTIEVIQKLSEFKNNLVFILWGKNAQEYKGLINKEKHYVISAPHPSPFSVYAGFYGHRPFSRTNSYLQATRQKSIEWRLE